jgi:hypothetical protein
MAKIDSNTISDKQVQITSGEAKTKYCAKRKFVLEKMMVSIIDVAPKSTPTTVPTKL